MWQLDKKLKFDKSVIDSPNLLDRFTEDDKKKIGSRVWDGYVRDRNSRLKWERRMSAAMDLAMQIADAKTFPWPGAANVVFPLVTIAALQFSARAYPAIIQGNNVVKYRVVVPDPSKEIKERAQRIGRYMSWQMLEEDEAWEEQHDRLLINCSIIGSAFVKTWFSGSHEASTCQFVQARDLYIDYFAKSVENAMRKTQVISLYRNEIYERIRSGIFSDVLEEKWYSSTPTLTDYTRKCDEDARIGRMLVQTDEDSAFQALEQHCFFDLDQDGYAEPYICTIEEGSKCPLRLVARVDREADVQRTSTGTIRKICPAEYFTKYSFIPSPDGGIYDIGFGAFLGPINEAVSSSINQLLDNGTLQNSIGGFLGRGTKIRGGVYTMAPWEWKRVDSTGDDLRKNLVPFPEKQPLNVTFQLISLLIQYADRLAGTTDTMVGENPGQNTPAETFRGMTEHGQAVYTMIFKRIWRCMKDEFKKKYVLNRTFLRSHVNFGSGKDWIRREDFLGDPDLIAPVADPNLSSTTLKIQQATAVLQAAMTTPGYDREEANRGWLRALGIDNVETVYPGEQNAKPLPNPKMMIEETKAQLAMAKEKAKDMREARKLMQQQPLIAAQIDKLKAEVVALIASVGAEKAASEVEKFEVQIKAFESANKAMTDRITSLLGNDGEDNEGNERGMGRVEGSTPNQTNSPPPPAPMAAGLNGAMGGGGIPQ